MNQLIVALREFSDADFQRRTWLAPEGHLISSFDEQVCQIFDDTGLSDVLGDEKSPPELSEQAFSVLKELDSAVSRIDHGAPPDRLLKDPRVEDLRKIAARALALVSERCP